MKEGYPIFIFDGGDGTGKTTQSLLLGSFLRKSRGIPVAYFSYPVYETGIGRTIGRSLSRWGSGQAIDMPSAEDMAYLFALNRLETLPSLEQLRRMGYLRICNRGPYANLFGVSKQALKEGVDWETLAPHEKKQRVDKILSFDNELLGAIGRRSEIVNIFLFLDPVESMELAAEKARSTLGGEPDRHEEWDELQNFVAVVYKEVTEGKILGYEAVFIRATRGSVRRQWDTPWVEKGLDELDGILKTAKEVSSTICPYLRKGCDFGGFWSEYAQDIPVIAVGLWRDSRTEVGVDFGFRQILGLPDDLGRDIFEERLDLLEEVARRPGVMVALEASWEMDRTIGIPRAR